MIHYIVQVVLFQLLFLLVYDLFLKRATFFSYNRAYLLCTSAIAFILPFVQIDAIRQTIPEAYRVQLPAVFIGDTSTILQDNTVVLDEVTVTQQGVSFTTIAISLYLLGVVIAAGFFVWKLRKLYLLKKRASLQQFEGYTVATVPETDSAFTFMKTIFLGAALSEAQKKHILQHELVHVQHQHTLDLLFFELLKICCWFNPMVYFFQKKLQALHEFTADRIVASENKTAYYQSLLSEVFGTTKISFINTFYKSSLIKNRIVMLQKSNSNRLVQLRYLLLLPLFAVMLTYTSCSNEKEEDIQTEANSTSQSDSEVMQKINELSEAMMKKGNISDEEVRALKFLATEAKEGDRIYTSVQEYLEEAPLSMTSIDKVPTYPGCTGANEELKKCMANEIARFVAENFNTKLANDVELTGRQRIHVKFEIDKNGKVAYPQARAPHPSLEAEALRVINKLPAMLPGEQSGKKVSVQYALPIVFEINE